MFTGISANLLVTSGLVKATLGLSISIIPICIGICIVGGALLIIGHYRWLDIVTKALMAFLTLATIAATFMALPLIDWSQPLVFFPAEFDLVTILFIAALIGWMPTPLMCPSGNHNGLSRIFERMATTRVSRKLVSILMSVILVLPFLRFVL